MEGLFALVCGVLMAAVGLALPVEKEETGTISIHMPKVQPKVADTYLCFPMKMPKEPTYLTKFTTQADMHVAHHILLFGCKKPGQEKGTWNCGEMMSHDSDMKQSPVCTEGESIIYAWGMDAPPLTLPEGVGFKVGGEEEVQWLVLQVHYKDVSSFLPPNNNFDTSGVDITSTTTPQPRRAGVYLMATGGEIAPNATVYMEAACQYEEDVVIHPFAYRTHAHTHGAVVSGYRVRDGEWTEIGRKSPQLPQSFYPVSNNITVENDDILAARCTMVNNETRTVSIGSTQNDEMCNFYIMYYVEGNASLPSQGCFSQGAPNWHWSMVEEIHSENAPQDASIIPGTNKLLEATKIMMANMEESMAQMEKEEEEMMGTILKGVFDGNVLMEAIMEEMFDSHGLQDLLEQREQEEQLYDEYVREEEAQKRAMAGYPNYMDDDDDDRMLDEQEYRMLRAMQGF